LLFIGRTIDHAEVRRRLRAAEPQVHTATVAEKQIDNWSQAIAAAVDAVLTDYPLEFRRHAAAIDD
jgi:glycerophosphoryl diester phosphodiesterase